MIADPPAIMTPYAVIHCPECNGAANFAFVTYTTIKKADIQYFKSSPNFEVFRGQHSDGSYFNAALYFPGLGDSLDNISDLPQSYKVTVWHSTRYAPSHSDLKNRGAIRCTECLVQKKHELKWPDEAYFQIEYKNRILWAYDRSSALKILDYLESDERKKAVEYYVEKPWNTYATEDWFLRQIPTHFKTAKARPEIVTKLRNMLGIRGT